MSFSPLVGSHFIQAGIVAYAIKGNLLASLIGTFVGNPWTFPLMWYASYALGVWLFGLFGFENLGEMPDEMGFAVMWDMIVTDPLRLFVPWLLGGYILVILSWPFYFLIFFYLVRAGKRARRLAKERQLKRKFKKEFREADQE